MEGSSPAVDDDDVVIVFSSAIQDCIYLSGYVMCSSVPIVDEVEEYDLDMRKSFAEFLLYNRSSFGSFADRFIVDGEDDDAYSPLC